jgi:nucleoside-diphosphate-sugar epimerase
MRVVILGANGQVGAETCLKLASISGIDLVPVSRTRNGSAYLRSKGVAVWHGDPAYEAKARAMFKGADIVVNLALANGVGRAGRIANEAIIASTIKFSPENAKVIFFSTLAVRGVWDGQGKRSQNAYGDLKQSNEHFFARLARKTGRGVWTLRLGHVCGTLQGLSHALQDEIRLGPVSLPDLNRASNTIYVASICEAIMAVGEGRSSPPGRYDLVNSPQWSWRQVYEHEAALTGGPVSFDALGPPLASRQSIKSLVFTAISRLGIRSALDRALPLLPGTTAEQIRADFMVSRAAGEIAALMPQQSVSNSAALWPALDIVPLDGVRPTAMLFDIFADMKAPQGAKWPSSLEPSTAV